MPPKAKYVVPKSKITLSLEDGHKLQDELVKAYEDEAFQKRLRAAWRKAGDDKVKQMQARQEVTQEVQIPIIRKYGFEPSRKGVNDSKLAFNDPKFMTEDIGEKYDYTIWLLDPDLQSMGPYVSKRVKVIKDKKKEAATGGYPAQQGSSETNSETQSKKFQPFIPLSKEQAFALQADLIAGFSTPEYRSRLLQAWKGQAYSTTEARQTKIKGINLEVQIPIMEKHGFDGSYMGVLQSLQSMSAEHLISDDQINWNSFYMLWLINPVEQAKHAERKVSTLEILSEDKTELCSLDFDFSATFRYAKERIQQETGIAWQAQKLQLVTSPAEEFADDFGAALQEDEEDKAALRPSPLSKSIGELHDMELVSSTVPIGKSAQIILVRRESKVVESLKSLCPVTSKRNKSISAKAVNDAVTQAVAKLPPGMLSSLDFLIPAVQLSTAALKAVLKAAPEEVRANRVVISTAVGLSGQAVQFASPELQDDRELVRAAVDSDGFSLQFASSRLQADREVVAAAVDNDGWALQYASEDLQKDVELASTAVERAGWVITSLVFELQINTEVVAKAVRQDPRVLEDLPPTMQSDKEVVMKAVGRDGTVLQYADEELQADREVVLAAVRKCGAAVRFASSELKSDRQVGLAAVKQDGMTLMLLGKNLHEDIEIVVAAVKQNFTAMKFVKAHQKPQVCAVLGIDIATANEYANVDRAKAEASASAGAAEGARAADKQVHLDALGLSESTTDSKTIIKQYRRLALIHHPDKNPDDVEGAKNRMAAINHAYQSLCQIFDF